MYRQCMSASCCVADGANYNTSKSNYYAQRTSDFPGKQLKHSAHCIRHLKQQCNRVRQNRTRVSVLLLPLYVVYKGKHLYSTWCKPSDGHDGTVYNSSPAGG